MRAATAAQTATRRVLMVGVLALAVPVAAILADGILAVGILAVGAPLAVRTSPLQS